jgi:cysteine desulfurase
MAKDLIYLDYAAATPLDSDVRAAMEPFWTEQFYNPSATYLPARGVKKSLETARRDIAACLGARASEIIFTAGGSEANNLAIHGVMAAWPDGSVVVSSVEHESILLPAEQYNVRLAPVDGRGRILVGELSELIDDTTVLVSVMYANNEVGTVQPIRDVAAKVQDIKADRKRRGIKRPLYLHTDAAQAANYLDLQVARLGVDLLTVNGGKIYGPKQSGVLFLKAGVVLRPLISGGGQERGLRSGTENVAASIGFAAALQKAVSLRETEVARLQQLQRHFIAELTAKLPHAQMNGSLKKRLPNNIHLTIPGTDNERLLLQLEQVGILAAAGSACSASNDEPSHVLRAMGQTDEQARGSLRFSMGRQTTRHDVDAVLATLTGLVG